MTIRFDGRVAIVTGAGGGLGRCHALGLAARGAKVVVNDLGRDGEPSEAALRVAGEIEAAGGVAIADGADVANADQVAAMVAVAQSRWGSVDILVNNAGILRDKSFANMDLADFRAVIEVHLMGAVHCTKAVWEVMRQQQYGRIVMTTSSSGLYGNFGQSNYGAAKMALVGLMQTLALEGAKYNIRVNCLAPTATTRMTQDIFGREAGALFAPEKVSPAVLALAGEDAPTRAIVGAGAGGFERAFITLTRGVHITLGDDAPDRIAASLAAISDRTNDIVPESALDQGQLEMTKAAAAANTQANA